MCAMPASGKLKTSGVSIHPAAAAAIRRAFGLMRAAQGHLRWWPARTPFEVCVGAILTQNTQWRNVMRALANLEAAGVMEAEALLGIPEAQLAGLLRPAGCCNVKARRLRAFLHILVHDHGGSLSRLFSGPLQDARARLLAIHGIGQETADSMLLYAGGRPSFVIDAYTRRIFTRHRWAGAGASYEWIQALCAEALAEPSPAGRVDDWGDCHAHWVRVGSEYCRPRSPRCHLCPLAALLPEDSPLQPGPQPRKPDPPDRLAAG